jgi:glycosyltransferase involved in cell wall biosynthesis
VFIYGKILAYMGEKSTEILGRLKHGQETIPRRRILILTTAYLPKVGGSELAIKNITDRLSEFDFDLITSRFSPDVPAYEKVGNVNVYRVGNSLSRFSFLLPKNFLPIAVFLKARELISKYGSYDFIHAYQASQAAGGGWLLKWFYPGIPFLVTVQEGKVLVNQSWLTKFFRYMIFKKADKATAISNYLAKYIVSQNKNLPVTIIPNGVNLQEFGVGGQELRENRTVITVSRLVEKNGVKDLIDAMAIVAEKIDDAKLWIIGDGPQKEELINKSKSLNLKNNVEFLGEIPNERLSKYLTKATVFVRPSLSEGLGTAFLEAMACGTAIIGTPVGGIPDFLRDGETGLFCESKNPQSIADKIIKIIENEELRQKLVKNSRELVEEKYNWNNIAEEFKRIYER